jgi:hypothetical protein
MHSSEVASLRNVGMFTSLNLVIAVSLAVLLMKKVYWCITDYWFESFIYKYLLMIQMKFFFMAAQTWLWLLLAVAGVVSPLSIDSSNVYTNEFAVEIDGDVTVADLVASTHSLRLVRQVKLSINSLRWLKSRNIIVHCEAINAHIVNIITLAFPGHIVLFANLFDVFHIASEVCFGPSSVSIMKYICPLT